jgi:cell division transport system ATP-binding protein
MIRFEHVYQDYLAGNFKLEDINFEVEKGDFVFLIGPSGAGKTTILKMILRESIPKSGNIFVDSQLISSKKFKEVEDLRKKIGTIFQDFKIVQDKNILENLLISLEILKHNDPKEEALKTLKKVGLENKSLFFPVQLSAGELQRLAIARSIVGGREIILADEPTGNLDPITSWEIMRLFRQIHSEKTTILFATHNTDIVNTLKKRVIVLKEGKLIKDNREGVYNLDRI